MPSPFARTVRRHRAHLFGHGGGLSVCTATLAFAAVLLYGFDLPLERLRQRWIEKQEAGTKNSLLSAIAPPPAATH